MTYKMPWMGLIGTEHCPNILQNSPCWVFKPDEVEVGRKKNLGFITCWWDTTPEDGEPAKFLQSWVTSSPATVSSEGKVSSAMILSQNYRKRGTFVIFMIAQGKIQYGKALRSLW